MGEIWFLGLYFAAFPSLAPLALEIGPLPSLPSTQLEVSRPPYIQLVWGVL